MPEVATIPRRQRVASAVEGQSWQPHSSTDIYLNTSTLGNISASFDGVPILSAPPLERGFSSSSAKASLSQSAASPISPNENASIMSHQGHPDAPPSPSYFSGLAKLPSPGQPTITFTGAPHEAALTLNSNLSPHFSSSSDSARPASVPSPMGYAGNFVPGVSAGPPSPRSSASLADVPGQGSATTPVSPGDTVRSAAAGSSSYTGFFSSFGPSSPKVSSHLREDSLSDRRKERSEKDSARDRSSGLSGGSTSSDQRMRRPSSVFEHVGNVWERFGRKVSHSRNATAEHGSTSGALFKRTSSVLSNSSGGLPEVLDKSEDRTSPSGSIKSGSQVSPSPLTPPEADRRSPSASDQRLPSWVEEPLSNEMVNNLTSQSIAPQSSRDTTSRSMTPSASSGSLQMWTAVGTEEGRKPASGSPAVSPAQEPMEFLDTDVSSAVRGAQRNFSAGSGSIESGHSSSMAHSRRISYLERVLIQVTEDNERFAVVDVSGVASSDAIKERMFAKLHLFDEDYSNFQLYRTEIGQTDTTGPVVNDDALLALCLQMGDDRGTLKFLVQQTSPPTNAMSRAMPPPTSASSPRRAIREIQGASGNLGTHLRSNSQSSRSSVSDALAYNEILSGETGTENSNRHSGSSLQRSRAQARRALPSAPLADELRSPVQPHAASGGYDQRSTASSTDGASAERPVRPDRVELRRSAASEMGPSRFSPVGEADQAKLRSFSPPLLGPRRPSIGQMSQPNAGSRSGNWDQTESQSSRSSHQNRLEDQHILPRSLQPAGRRPDSGHEVQQLGPARNHSRFQSDGNGVASASQPKSQLTIHSVKSMDDLRKRQPPPPPPVPSPMHIPFDRDGRYPDPSIVRPSTAAPAAQRQLSSDAHMERMPPQQMFPDPRMLQRNRSAQAALATGGQPSSGPMRGPGNAPNGDRPLRSPAMGPREAAGAMMDPRFARPMMADDPRFGVHRGPSQQHPHMHHGGSVRPGTAGVIPGYGQPAQAYGHAAHTYDPHRPPLMAAGYMNEFGARIPMQHHGQFHPHDPRMVGTMQGPYPSRPHTYHDHPPFSSQRAPMAASPPYRAREDPFTSKYFPASSSRQVSEFQRAAGRLQPGMTVQETMGPRGPTPQPSFHPSHSLASAPAYGPRDVRRPATANEFHHSSSPRWPSNGHLSPRHEHLPALQNPHDRAPSSQHPAQAQQSMSAQHGHSLSRPQARPSRQPDPNYSAHARDSNARPNVSKRSSGSSFGSSGSHVRNFSNEERHNRSSIEDSFSAPTSARSSHSGPTHAELSKEADSRRSTHTEDDDLEDDDLINIRPLPKPPQHSSDSGESPSSATEPNIPRLTLVNVDGMPKASNDEGTLKATQWASLWNALDKAGQENLGGTMTSNSSGDADTLRPDRSNSFATDQSVSSETTIVPSDQGQADASKVNEGGRDSSPSFAPDENGTMASFASFDDDESESGTWAQPLGSSSNMPQLPLKVDFSKNDDNRTLQPGSVSLFDPGVSPKSTPIADNPTTATSSPRRPELRLTIEPPTAGTSTPLRRASPRTATIPALANLSSTLGSGGITRSNSFAKRDNDWAFRPPPEQLYENLDDFFPKHDLDKPLLDTAGIPGSPLVHSPKSETSPAQALPPSNAAALPFAQRTRHKKSIRIVAQDRKRILDRADKRTQAQDAITGPLARRRSTRLWGTKVVEMTPGQEVTTPASAASTESLTLEGNHKPVFKWVKGDLIGKGTYGRVYLALNATTGEMIAVKQVELPRTASDREDSRQKGVVAALKSEIETLKDLDHPHIVSYLGFEETSSFLSIFLEYVPGGSVGSCLRKHGKFEEATIKSFLHQILEGLAYLHSKGILHRDLKADNILVDFEGICKISDFGTVRRSDDIYGNVENMSLQGSIFWMAPEVVSLSKKGYSAKVDIWSLGCVVLEMFAGRRPWSDDEAVQAMFKIGAERRAPPIPADVMLSKKAAHFLKNCFEIDPAKRPTAERLLDHRFSIPEEGWEFHQSALWRSLKK